MSGLDDASIHIESEGGKPPSAEMLQGRVAKLAAQSNTTDRYQIRGEIARGGMGAILRVFDDDLRRELAMKVMLSEGDSQLGSAFDANGIESKTPAVSLKLARFLDEAQVTGQLDHPGVPPVHEIGVDKEGKIYFTMPLIRGRELVDVINSVHAEDNDRWSMQQGIGVILRVCETMAYAHSKGVIHRDLKPANIMVGKFGEVYVMDWGLAAMPGTPDTHNIRLPQSTYDSLGSMSSIKSIRTDRKNVSQEPFDSPLRTVDGSVVGTPYYMPPEQARGEIDKVGALSDVYSVGAMLYHLITGAVPYSEPGIRQSPLQVLQQVMEGPPDSLQSISSNIPAELEAICERAMARDPNARYRSMNALAEDLRRYQEGRVVQAYKTGALAEFQKWVKRNRALAGTMASVIFVAIAGLASTTYVQAKERKVSEANAERANEASREAVAALRDATAKSYVANVAAAAVNLDVGNLPQARRHLADCAPEYRGWEWRHFQLRQNLAGHTFDLGEGPIDFLTVSPDGKQIACATYSKWRIWDSETGAELANFERPGEQVLSASFNVDSSVFASASWNGAVRLWDLAGGGKRIADLKIDETAVPTMTFSPDGKRIAAGSGSDAVYVWDSRSGVPLALIRLADSGAIQSLVFDGSNRRIAVGTGAPDHAIHVWQIDSQVREGTLRGHERPVTSLLFSPDDRRLVSGSFDASVRIWDVERLTQLHVLSGHTEPVNAVAMDPLGERIASCSKDGTVRIWSATEGTEHAQLAVGEEWVVSVHFSQDGRRLFSKSVHGAVRAWNADNGAELALLHPPDENADRRASSAMGDFAVKSDSRGVVSVWSPLTEPGYATLEGHAEEVTSAVFTPDGENLVSASFDGTVTIWNAQRGAPLRRLEGHTDGVRAVAVSPNGELIASGSDDYTVRLWNPSDGRLLNTLEGHEDWVACVAISPDGTRIASGGDSGDSSLRIWNASDGAPLASANDHTDGIWTVSFSPDGTRIVTGSADTTLRIWDSATTKSLFVLEGHSGPVRAAAIAPDGAWLVSAGDDGDLRLWSLADGSGRLAVLPGHEEEVHALALSPDGARIFSAGANGFIRVWDSRSRSTLAVLSGHSALISALAVDPTGGRLVSGSYDRSLRVWLTEPTIAHRMWRSISLARMVQPLVYGLLEEHGDSNVVRRLIESDSELKFELKETALRQLTAIGN